MRLEDEYNDTKSLRPGDHIRLAKLAAKIAERKTARTRIEAWAEEGLEHLRDAGVNVPEEYYELSPQGKLKMLIKLLKGV